MSQQPASRSAGPSRRRWAAPTFWGLRLVLGVHALMAVTQPIMAGSYLSGNVDAIAVHGAVGSSLIFVGMVQVVVAALAAWPGGGPWWPVPATLALVVAEVVQVSAGYARTLGLHIPLGVAIVGSTVAMFVWSLTRRAAAAAADLPATEPLDAPAAQLAEPPAAQRADPSAAQPLDAPGAQPADAPGLRSAGAAPEGGG